MDRDSEPTPVTGEHDRRSIERVAEPSEAFDLLGNEVRIAIIRALADASSVDGVKALSFSELQVRVGTPTSAGLAYHLRQLRGHYITRTVEGYRLTSAGRRVARAIVAGTYTDRVAIKVIAVREACPLCERFGLVARCQDNTVTIECACVETPIARLPLPPGGHRRPVEGELLETFDRYHRHRIALMAEGICAECASSVTATIDRVAAPDVGSDALERESRSQSDRRAQLRFECTECALELRSPVAFAVVEHPAVIGFFDSHGVDVRGRPLWNLGDEWSETVLSEDPWCVRVSLRLDDDRLDLLVGEAMTVHVLGDRGERTAE